VFSEEKVDIVHRVSFICYYVIMLYLIYIMVTKRGRNSRHFFRLGSGCIIGDVDEARGEGCERAGLKPSKLLGAEALYERAGLKPY
jgi:hypothetical protein